MGSAPTPPPVTSANTMINAQQSANTQAGYASQAGSATNQSNPYGSLTYTPYTDAQGNKRFKANVQYTPLGQQLLDYLQGTQKTAGQAAGRVLSQGGYGEGAPDLGTSAGSIVNQNLGNFTKSLDPHFTKQSEDLDNQLRNQGLFPGSPGYDRQMNELRQSQGQTISGFLAQAEPEAYSQAVSSYQLPMQTAAQLSQLGQPANLQGSFINTPGANYQSVNALGAYGQQTAQAQANYQNKQQNYSDMMKGIYGAAGTIAGTALGGPIGGSLGGSLGSSFGGGGAPTTGGGYGTWAPSVFYR